MLKMSTRKLACPARLYPFELARGGPRLALSVGLGKLTSQSLRK